MNKTKIIRNTRLNLNQEEGLKNLNIDDDGTIYIGDESLPDILDSKQDNLIQGDNITIVNNKISAHAPAGEQGPKGDPGDTPYIKDGNWWIGDADTGIPATGESGQDGYTPYIGSNNDWWINGADTGKTAVAKDGKDGKDGNTPYISNGYWFINGTSTGVKATGENGKDGTDGNTPYISNGYWYINGSSTGVKATGDKGDTGAAGQDGVSPHIGSNNHWFIGDTDTNVSATGPTGASGKNGDTPYISNGVWYISGKSTGVSATGPTGPQGISVTNCQVNDTNHLIQTLSSGDTIDAGLVTNGLTDLTLANLTADNVTCNSMFTINGDVMFEGGTFDLSGGSGGTIYSLDEWNVEINPITGVDDLVTLQAVYDDTISKITANTTAIAAKQDKMSAGNGITITDGVAINCKVYDWTGTVLNYTNTIALGTAAKASATYSTGLGCSAQATASYGTAVGYGAKALKTNSTAIGYNAKAQTGVQSTAIGASANAGVMYGTAVGYGTTCTGQYGFAGGMNATANQTGMVAFPYIKMLVTASAFTVPTGWTAIYWYPAEGGSTLSTNIVQAPATIDEQGDMVFIICFKTL